MNTASLDPIGISQSRCRGEWLDKGVFLVYTRDGVDIFHMVPNTYCGVPEEFHGYLVDANDAVISMPLAGGGFSTSFFDFTMVPNDMDTIPLIFKRLFANPAIDNEHWLQRFISARILIRSRETGWGSVSDVLRAS
jgi:hypothetical protein